MLNISSRKTFMTTINKIGEVGKKKVRDTVSVSLFVFDLVSVTFAGFSGGYSNM